MLLLAQRGYSTHIRAGNILTERLSALKYKFTLIVYTNSLASVDDPTATLDFGDGTTLEQPRISKTPIGSDTYENIYTFEHTFPATGFYTVGYTESNRNASIKNIGNSVNTPFYIESLISVTSGATNLNSSPQMAIPPLDKAQKGRLFVYNPGAYDVNGDSISFKLVTPRQARGVDVSGYFTPDNLTLNSITGDLVWDVPQEEGLFNVAFIVEEWRNGVRIGYVTRDMQINVLPADNRPPELSPGIDTCVVAGDTVTFTISATDPDGDDVKLTSTDIYKPLTGVYALGATFSNPPQGKNPKGTFVWVTECEDARSQPHQVEFRAEDVPPSPRQSLTDYQFIRIKVIAPSPKILSIVSEDGNLRINWEKYNCGTAANIQIFRKSCDTTKYQQGPCDVGSTGFPGYTFIDEVSGTETTFLDSNDIKRGNFYCYILVANFPLPKGGISKASEVECGGLKDDAAVLASVSVDSTDKVSGQTTIKWFNPIHPPLVPFVYKIFRGIGLKSDNYLEIGETADTIFVDKPLNTMDTSYNYRVDIVFTETIQSSTASTLFLKSKPGDRKVNLSWTMDVPWNIDSLRLFRKANNETSFTYYKTITGSLLNGVFVDENLVNCDTFCYYLESFGSYCSGLYPRPLVSRSEIVCEVPVNDQIPPPPFLSIISQDCNNPILINRNLLFWTNVADPICNNIDHYNIYFAQYEDDELAFFKSVPDTSYIDIDSLSLSGCYAVTAVNVFGVEGPQSNRVCVDNCVYYELPNLITPNNDDRNDEVIPFPTPRYVEKVKYYVYNRWGDLVHFQDNDIFIHWNGGANVDGIYYYLAEVKYVKRLRKKDEIARLKGWLQILR